MLRSPISVIVILYIFIICIWNSCNERLWKTPGVIIWDINCYYAYLQEAFNDRSYGDPPIQDEINLAGLAPVQKYKPAPNGNMVIKTSMGMAYFYLPFYAIGHLAYYLGHGNAGSGLEEKYRIAMQFFGSFILLIGLFLLLKLLQRYYTDQVSAITIFALALGTNLFYYTTYEGCMTHVVNFSLFVAFLLLTIRWYGNISVCNSILLGLLAGLIVLIRPVNILIGVFFVLYSITSVKQLHERVLLLLRNIHLILLMGTAAILVWVPQLIYWYKMTGHVFYYSYGNEGFLFDEPMNIWLGLFSGRKGWLLYTPMGILMVMGMFYMHKYVKEWLWALALFFPIFIYVIYSWWSWYYSGSFSSRPMVDIYGVLALALASLITYIGSQRKRFAKVILGVIILFFIFLNQFQNYQFKKGMIHYSDMTFEAYKYVFLRLDRYPPHDLLERPPGL